MGRKNLKIPEPLFNALRDDKPDNMSWPAYLERECLDGDADLPEGFLDVMEASKSDIEELKRMMDELPKKTADELETRLR